MKMGRISSQSNLLSDVNNLHHDFIGLFRCYSGQIGENLQKIAQNAQKVDFLGQDDVIGPKW